jgi:hypothetical protein
MGRYIGLDFFLGVFLHGEHAASYQILKKMVQMKLKLILPQLHQAQLTFWRSARSFGITPMAM